MAPKRNPHKPVDPEPEDDLPAIDLGISERTLKDLTAVFKLLADRHRLKIVLALAQEGQMHVTALCNVLKQSQPAVSHHLTLMRMVGLIRFERSGKHNYYQLDSAFLGDLIEQFFADTGNNRQMLELDEFSLSFTRREEE
jgi:ArsR family transcriptional regulator